MPKSPCGLGTSRMRLLPHFEQVQPDTLQGRAPWRANKDRLLASYREPGVRDTL